MRHQHYSLVFDKAQPLPAPFSIVVWAMGAILFSFKTHHHTASSKMKCNKFAEEQRATAAKRICTENSYPLLHLTQKPFTTSNHQLQKAERENVLAS